MCAYCSSSVIEAQPGSFESFECATFCECEPLPDSTSAFDLSGLMCTSFWCGGTKVPSLR